MIFCKIWSHLHSSGIFHARNDSFFSPSLSPPKKNPTQTTIRMIRNVKFLSEELHILLFFASGTPRYMQICKISELDVGLENNG